MNNENFQKVLDHRVEELIRVLAQKAGEYANDGDRLANFRRAMEISSGPKESRTMAKALWGMLIKHIVSVTDLIEGHVYVTRPLLDEKIGDVMAYFVLLDAVLQEQIDVDAKAKAKVEKAARK